MGGGKKERKNRHESINHNYSKSHDVFCFLRINKTGNEKQECIIISKPHVLLLNNRYNII